ncbi:hypothetical protein A0H81_13484 [Grifola frondosa]|uniref:Uncharacterized protein n=1 Tax=Grifola frondosa TaxID=5627 RepID=A0A1C7LP96_GRIFR|nr:hypothetical protein A0H81_13484 [Grifola frondosa]
MLQRKFDTGDEPAITVISATNVRMLLGLSGVLCCSYLPCGVVTCSKIRRPAYFLPRYHGADDRPPFLET